MLQILINDKIQNVATLLYFHTISVSEDDPISDADAVSETNTNTTQMNEDECGNMVIVLVPTCRRYKIFDYEGALPVSNIYSDVQLIVVA